MKNSRKNSRPKFPTCGNACITVSKRARIPFAIFSSFKTVRKRVHRFRVPTDFNYVQAEYLSTDLRHSFNCSIQFTSSNSQDSHHANYGRINWNDFRLDLLKNDTNHRQYHDSYVQLIPSETKRFFLVLSITWN